MIFVSCLSKLFDMKYFIGLFVFVASLTTAFSQQIRAKDSKVEMPVVQPLYVLDGKVISSQNVDRDSIGSIVGLKSINPNEIESINVLKGVAAIERYGEAGKNGVIVFNTFA